MAHQFITILLQTLLWNAVLYFTMLCDISAKVFHNTFECELLHRTGLLFTMMHVCKLCSRCATMLCATAAVVSWWCITVDLHLTFVRIPFPLPLLLPLEPAMQLLLQSLRILLTTGTYRQHTDSWYMLVHPSACWTNCWCLMEYRGESARVVPTTAVLLHFTQHPLLHFAS